MACPLALDSLNPAEVGGIEAVQLFVDRPAAAPDPTAAIECSHRLLSGPDQVLFRRLAVFAGGCTPEAAEEVCADDDLDVLLLVAALVDKSLLIQEPAGGGRYWMLETIRQFAWEELRQAGEVEALRARHRDWCLALVEVAEFATPAARVWLARLAAEQDNFRAPWSGTTPLPCLRLVLQP